MKVEQGGQPCLMSVQERFENTGNLHQLYLSKLGLWKCFNCVHSFIGTFSPVWLQPFEQFDSHLGVISHQSWEFS